MGKVVVVRGCDSRGGEGFGGGDVGDSSDGGLGVEMAAEWYYDEGGGWRLSWCGQKWWCYSGCGNGGGGGCHRGGSGGSGGVHRWIEGGLVVGVETWRLGWFRHGGKWPEFLAGISPEIMAAPEVVGEERGRC
ncbi:hypothetical protein Tco_0987424 [Tanacetum coccineum]